MRYEKSCGAVVYRRVQQQVEYLILKMQHGHFSLPKGHVESGESERQTARREIREETNCEVTIHRGFRQVVTYSPQPFVSKDVVFFLARYRSGRLTAQPEEVADLAWMSFEDALRTLTYESDRQLIRFAAAFLNQ